MIDVKKCRQVALTQLEHNEGPTFWTNYDKRGFETERLITNQVQGNFEKMSRQSGNLTKLASVPDTIVSQVC